MSLGAPVLPPDDCGNATRSGVVAEHVAQRRGPREHLVGDPQPDGGALAERGGEGEGAVDRRGHRPVPSPSAVSRVPNLAVVSASSAAGSESATTPAPA